MMGGSRSLTALPAGFEMKSATDCGGAGGGLGVAIEGSRTGSRVAFAASFTLRCGIKPGPPEGPKAPRLCDGKRFGSARKRVEAVESLDGFQYDILLVWLDGASVDGRKSSHCGEGNDGSMRHTVEDDVDKGFLPCGA